MDKKINYAAFGIIIVLLYILFFNFEEKQEPVKQNKIIEIPVNISKKVEQNSIETVESPNTTLKEDAGINIKKEPITEKKEEEKQNTSDEELVKNINISDIDPYDIKLKEEMTTLSSFSDKERRYTILLKSSQKIDSVLPSSRYILLEGLLEEDGELSKFSTSFNQYYKDYIEYIFMEVKNNETGNKASCDGLFLSGVDPEHRYFIKLELSGDILSCYLEREEKISDINQIINIREIGNDKDLQNLDMLSQRKREN